MYLLTQIRHLRSTACVLIVTHIVLASAFSQKLYFVTPEESTTPPPIMEIPAEGWTPGHASPKIGQIRTITIWRTEVPGLPVTAGEGDRFPEAKCKIDSSGFKLAEDTGIMVQGSIPGSSPIEYAAYDASAPAAKDGGRAWIGGSPGYGSSGSIPLPEEITFLVTEKSVVLKFVAYPNYLPNTKTLERNKELVFSLGSSSRNYSIKQAGKNAEFLLMGKSKPIVIPYSIGTRPMPRGRLTTEGAGVLVDGFGSQDHQDNVWFDVTVVNRPIYFGTPGNYLTNNTLDGAVARYSPHIRVELDKLPDESEVDWLHLSTNTRNPTDDFVFSSEISGENQTFPPEFGRNGSHQMDLVFIGDDSGLASDGGEPIRSTHFALLVAPNSSANAISDSRSHNLTVYPATDDGSPPFKVSIDQEGADNRCVFVAHKDVLSTAEGVKVPTIVPTSPDGRVEGFTHFYGAFNDFGPGYSLLEVDVYALLRNTDGRHLIFEIEEDNDDPEAGISPSPWLTFSDDFFGREDQSSAITITSTRLGTLPTVETNGEKIIGGENDDLEPGEPAYRWGESFTKSLRVRALSNHMPGRNSEERSATIIATAADSSGKIGEPLRLSFVQAPVEDDVTVVAENPTLPPVDPGNGGTLRYTSVTLTSEIEGGKFTLISDADWLNLIGSNYRVTEDTDPSTGVFSARASYTYGENLPSEPGGFSETRVAKISLEGVPGKFATITQPGAGIAVLSVRQGGLNTPESRYAQVRFRLGAQQELNQLRLYARGENQTDDFFVLIPTRSVAGATDVEPGDDHSLWWDPSEFIAGFAEGEKIVVRVVDEEGLYGDSAAFVFDPNCVCEDCDSTPGTTSASVQPATVSHSLGTLDGGGNAGSAWVGGDASLDGFPENIGTPEALKVNCFGTTRELVHTSGSSAGRQIITDNVLIDAVSDGMPANTWELRYYESPGADQATDETTGLYDQSSASPYQTIRYSHLPVAPSGGSLLTVTESGILGERRMEILSEPQATPGTTRWSLAHYGNGAAPLRIQTIVRSRPVGSRLRRVDDISISKADGKLLSRAIESFDTFPFGERLLKKTEFVIGTGMEEPKSRTTKWRYEESPESPAFGNLLERTNTYGKDWIRFGYDDMGRLNEVRRPYLGNALNVGDSTEEGIEIRRVTYESANYDGRLGLDRATITEVERGGSIVSRRFRIEINNYSEFTPPATSESLDITATTLDIATPQQAYDAAIGLQSSVLVTRTTRYVGARFGNSPNGLGIQSIVLPNGVTTTYTHTPTTTTTRQTNRFGLVLSTTVEQRNEFGQPAVTTIERSGVVLQSDTATEFDELGRPLTIEHLDGSVTKRTYTCCGLDSETAPDGTVTTYGYDALKRLTSTTRAGITELINLNSLGRPTSRSIFGAASDGSMLTSSTSQDSIGLETTTTLSDGATTRVVRETDPDTGIATTTSTSRSGGERIEKRYPDGRLFEVTGTAVPIWIRYAYATGVALPGTPEGEAPLLCSTTTAAVIEPSTGALTGEYTTTYSDPAGRTVRTEFPPLKPSGVIPANSYLYNSVGQLAASIDADGVSTLYGYDSEGRRTTTAIDSNGNGTIDEVGSDRITRQTYSVGTYEGKPVETVETRVSHTSNRTFFHIRSLHRSADGRDVWGIDYPSTSYEAVEHSSVVYDPLSKSSTITTSLPDGATRVTKHVEGRPISLLTTTPDGDVVEHVTTTYDDFGREMTVSWHETESIDSPFRSTTRYYDDASRVIRVQESATSAPGSTEPAPADRNISFQHIENPATGTTIRTTLPDGESRVTLYDHAGRMIETGGAQEISARYTYAPGGQRSSLATAQDGNLSGALKTHTLWTYNAQGRLAAKYYASDNSSTPGAGASPAHSYTYTPAGRIITATDARGVVATSSYFDHTQDLMGITYSHGDEVAPTPDISYKSYNRLGIPLEVTDALGTRTRVFDSATLRVTSEPAPSGHSVVGAYTGLGARLSGMELRDAEGNVMPGTVSTYNYDSVGRLASLASLGFGGSPDITASYAYLAGRGSVPSGSVLTKRDAGGAPETILATSDSYDGFGQLARKSQESAAFRFSAAYGYNTLGQRTEVTLSEELTGNPAPAYQPNSQEVSYDHTSMFGYDSLGQLTNATSELPGRSFAYTYDKIGNRLTATTDGDADTTSSATANPLNQVERLDPPVAFDLHGSVHADASIVVNGAPASRPPPTGLSSDPDFRRFFARVPVTSLYQDITTSASLPDPNGELLDAEATLTQSFSTSGTTAVEPVYDAAGNLLSDTRFSYTWDANSRLASASTLPGAVSAGAPNLEISFSYDHRGRRVSKSVSVDGEPEETTYFLYHGLQLMAEIRPDGTASTYTWGLDVAGSPNATAGVGGLLHSRTTTSDTASSVVSALAMYDGNGNLTGWIDPDPEADTPEVLARYEYTPFGKPLASSYRDPAAKALLSRSGFSFSTKYRDIETGLLYYGFRHYHPELGRWLSRDPIAEDGGLNLYGFNYNDPINFIDILGYKPRSEMGFFERMAFDASNKVTGGAPNSVNTTNALGEAQAEALVRGDGDAAIQIAIANQQRVNSQQINSARAVINSGAITFELAIPEPASTAHATSEVLGGILGLLAKAGRRCECAPRKFENQLQGLLQQEIAQASRVGAKPLRVTDKAFAGALNQGTIKYVVTESGDVLITPHTVNGVEISHAVLSGGRPVFAAGQADIASASGQVIGISLNTHSGHFLNGACAEINDEVLAIAKEAFKQIGIHFP